MANTSCNELLSYCLRGEKWPRALLEAAAEDECLFRVVAEGLADRFEPSLCETYRELFSEAIALVMPEARLRQAAPPLPPPARVDRVFVLSRVTLGADVAVTSVILDAAKRRFPDAEIYLVGGRKNWELFAADPAIRHLPVQYPRGTLRQRLALWPELKQALDRPHSLVIDPDSRLTQLGLLPVCPEENYLFFESRSYGGDGDEPLPALARRWVRETLGVEGAPYVAPAEQPESGPGPVITVSLGVGENAAKRIDDPFEEKLLAQLRGIWIDKGAGGEEAARVERAIARSGVEARTWEGSFAGFASIIARSDLYIGYDSAGQHVAAACGVPLVSIFAGYPSQRMFLRWRPSGSGRIDVIQVEDRDPERVFAQVQRSLAGRFEDH